MKKVCRRGLRPHREVVYQIFPDRWMRTPDRPLPEKDALGRKVEYSEDRRILTEGKTCQHTFYGGTLEGIRRSIPYLSSLGVTAVYLTPIFAASSTHRYDAVDYFSIDPILGTRTDFERLSESLHGTGMQLVLDGVLNHTSHHHRWHVDPRERRKRFIMKSRDESMTWMNRGTLPKLDVQNPRVAKQVLDVLAAWPEADAWRLDAAHLLPQEFLKRLHKEVSPRPVIIEDWMIGRQYFSKRIADGVTNFLCRETLRNFFREDCSPETLLDRIDTWSHLYPHRNLGMSWNFLDNHDTDRFSNQVGRSRLTRALVLLFSLPGTPMLYHGDEVGLAGRDSLESRAPMPWDSKDQDGEILALVQRLATSRARNEALQEGRFTPVFADNRTRSFAFLRSTRHDETLVAMNDGYLPCRVRCAGAGAFTLKPGAWKILSLASAGRSKVLVEGD